MPLNKVSEVLREKYSSGDPLADQKRYGGIVNDSVNVGTLLPVQVNNANND